MSPVVVLVGPPGSGKSTIAALLAGRLGKAHRDTDIDIENAAGKPISDIFVDSGEAHFRRLERAAVIAALTSDDVVSLGGVVEVVVDGLPPGLGSYVHWDRRLDSKLAGALMGIQAIKGV